MLSTNCSDFLEAVRDKNAVVMFKSMGSRAFACARRKAVDSKRVGD